MKNSHDINFSILIKIIATIILSITITAIAKRSYAASDIKYPTRAVTLVTPYATGGTSDAVLFSFNEALSKELGQPIIYEHKPGAHTNIGSEYVAKSKPDGYTILFSAFGLIQNRWFGPYPSIDLLDALEPVIQVMNVGGIISSNNELGAKNWDELRKIAINKSRNLNIGSAQADVTIKQIIRAASDINLISIPYKGGGPAMTDLMGGHIDLIWGFLPAQYSAIKAGRIQPIAVTSSKRLSQLPNVKTLSEMGVNYKQDGWYGLFVPKGTDLSIIEKLASATEKVMRDKKIQQVFIDAGAEPVISTRSEFINLIEKDNLLFQRLSRELPDLVMK